MHMLYPSKACSHHPNLYHYIIIIYLHPSKTPSPSRGFRSARCRVYRQYAVSETNHYIKNYTRKTTKAATIAAVRPPLFSADAAPCVSVGKLSVAEAVLLPFVGFRVLEGRVEDSAEVEVAKDPFGVEADRCVEDDPEAAELCTLVLDRPDTCVVPEDFPAVPEDPLAVSEDPPAGFSEDSLALLEGFSEAPLVVSEDPLVVLEGFSEAPLVVLEGSLKVPLMVVEGSCEDPAVLDGSSVVPEDFLMVFEDSLAVIDDSSVVLDGFSVTLLDSLVERGDSFAELSVLLVGRSVGIRVSVVLLELLVVSTFFFKVSQ